MKSLGYLFGATTLMGAIGWPVLFFVQDAANGLAGRWTVMIALSWSAIGFMLGAVVAVFMYLGFKFLLEMGWLPSRRDS